MMSPSISHVCDITCNITCVVLFDDITYIVCDIAILTVISRMISMHFCAFSVMLYVISPFWYVISMFLHVISRYFVADVLYMLHDITCDIPFFFRFFSAIKNGCSPAAFSWLGFYYNSCRADKIRAHTLLMNISQSAQP